VTWDDVLLRTDEIYARAAKVLADRTLGG
jgi:hypothetical protein